MKVTWLQYLKFCIYFYVTPFAIGAAFHYVGAWAGWPALLIGMTVWIGNMIHFSKIYEKQKASEEEQGNDR